MFQNELACAVILYDCDLNVLQNIQTYIDFFSCIYIFDNSPIPNSDLVKDLIGFKTVCYISYNINYGIAYALNHVCNAAYCDGYTWLLTMDQDSYFTDSLFFDTAKPYLTSIKNAAIISAANNVDDYKTVKYYDSNLSELITVITSGALMSLNAWKNIGGFESKLFIDEVDNDFCLRAIAGGYKIFVTNKIFLNHLIGQNIESHKKTHNVTVSSKAIINVSSPFRIYYVWRNGLYMIRKYYKRFPNYAILKIKSLLVNFYKVLFYYPKKQTCLKFMCAGILHFVFNRYGHYEIAKR